VNNRVEPWHKHRILSSLATLCGNSMSADNAAYFTGLSVVQVRKAAIAMARDQWIDWQHGRMWIRDEGRQALKDASDNPELATAPRDAQWKDEALTGITEAGKRSKINRAVLKTGQEVRTATTPAEARSEIGIKSRQLARQFKRPAAEVEAMLLIGFGEREGPQCIKKCNSCNKYGIFSKRTRGGWNGWCLSCDARRKRK